MKSKSLPSRLKNIKPRGTTPLIDPGKPEAGAFVKGSAIDAAKKAELASSHASQTRKRK